MTRVSSFDVTLDTCVLFPITLCDTLLRLAEAGVFRPHWSKETLAELERNLVSKLGLSEKAARRRVPRDPNDWPVVALALLLDAAILTGDNDFLGCGCPTWTVETLRDQLEGSAPT